MKIHIFLITFLMTADVYASMKFKITAKVRKNSVTLQNRSKHSSSSIWKVQPLCEFVMNEAHPSRRKIIFKYLKKKGLNKKKILVAKAKDFKRSGKVRFINARGPIGLKHALTIVINTFAVFPIPVIPVSLHFKYTISGGRSLVFAIDAGVGRNYLLRYSEKSIGLNYYFYSGQDFEATSKNPVHSAFLGIRFYSFQDEAGKEPHRFLAWDRQQYFGMGPEIGYQVRITNWFRWGTVLSLPFASLSGRSTQLVYPRINMLFEIGPTFP